MKKRPGAVVVTFNRGGEGVGGTLTDAYLLGLALSQHGFLATLDERLSALILPSSAESAALVVVD